LIPWLPRRRRRRLAVHVEHLEALRLEVGALVGEVARVLEPGGRFAFHGREGRPLTQQERARMPGADTVWPIELAELTAVLRNAGLTVIWRQEYSSSITRQRRRCFAVIELILPRSPARSGRRPPPI